MLGWIWRGLRTGVVTTRYPNGSVEMPAAYRGRPVLDPERCDPSACNACADVCLPRAISVDLGVLRLDVARCITCSYCVEACPTGAFTMRNDVELAVQARADLVTVLWLGAGIIRGPQRAPGRVSEDGHGHVETAGS